MDWKHPAVITVGFGGLQAVFSLLSGQVVSHFTALGLSPTEITLALLSGPICGTIFQPYFGNWSDGCRSPWGKRRPFIIFGTLWLTACLISLAWIDRIVPYQQQPSASHHLYLTLCTVFLTIAIFTSIQAVQVGLRALVTDSRTPAEQAKCNAWAGRHTNFASVLGSAPAAIHSSNYDANGIAQTAFASSSLFVVLYLGVTIFIACCCNTENIQHEQPSSNQSHKSQGGNQRFWQTLLSEESEQIRKIFVVQFFSWLGWFPFLYYVVSYVNSLGENSTIGNAVPFIYSTVSLAVALLLPHQYPGRGVSSLNSPQSSISLRKMWMFSHALFAITMLATFMVHSTTGTMILFASIGVSWALNCRIPYSLLGYELCGKYEPSLLTESQGLVHGMHNIMICLPQILVMTLMATMWLFTEAERGFGPVVWFLRLAGLSALVALYFTTKVREQGHHGTVGFGGALPEGCSLDEMSL